MFELPLYINLRQATATTTTTTTTTTVFHYMRPGAGKLQELAIRDSLC